MEYKRDEFKDVFASVPAVGFESHFDNTESNSYHIDVQGNEVRFNFMDESAGTQCLAYFFGIVLIVVRAGTVLVTGELGNSIRSLLLAVIMKVFKDKRYDTSNPCVRFRNLKMFTNDLITSTDKVPEMAPSHHPIHSILRTMFIESICPILLTVSWLRWRKDAISLRAWPSVMAS